MCHTHGLLLGHRNTVLCKTCFFCLEVGSSLAHVTPHTHLKIEMAKCFGFVCFIFPKQVVVTAAEVSF